MTLGNFKKLLESKNKTSTKLPIKNSEIGILIKEAIEMISMEVIPLDLTTKDVTKPTFRWIDNQTKIRQSFIPVNDTDLIDIDEALVYAVAYEFLANHLEDDSRASYYIGKRNEVMDKYNWNNFKLLEELKA